MKIKVRDKHVKNPNRYDGNSCMVHEAIVDAFPDMTLRNFFVGPGYIEVILDDDEQPRKITQGLGPRVQGKISAFDRNQNVKPFEFDLPDDFVEQLRAK